MAAAVNGGTDFVVEIRQLEVGAPGRGRGSLQGGSFGSPYHRRVSNAIEGYRLCPLT